MIPRYAGFRQRTAAALADIAILNVIETFIFAPLGWEWLSAPPEDLAWRTPLLILLGVPLLYDTVLTSSRRQATWGKRFIGLYVADLNGDRLSPWHAAFRHLVKYVTAATLAVGVLIQPFTYRKQALHDLLSRTVVRER